MHGWGMIPGMLVALLQCVRGFPERVPEPRNVSSHGLQWPSPFGSEAIDRLGKAKRASTTPPSPLEGDEASDQP